MPDVTSDQQRQRWGICEFFKRASRANILFKVAFEIPEIFKVLSVYIPKGKTTFMTINLLTPFRVDLTYFSWFLSLFISPHISWL
jgi:hypothetical protein